MARGSLQDLRQLAAPRAFASAGTRPEVAGSPAVPKTADPRVEFNEDSWFGRVESMLERSHAELLAKLDRWLENAGAPSRSPPSAWSCGGWQTQLGLLEEAEHETKEEETDQKSGQGSDHSRHSPRRDHEDSQDLDDELMNSQLTTRRSSRAFSRNVFEMRRALSHKLAEDRDYDDLDHFERAQDKKLKRGNFTTLRSHRMLDDTRLWGRRSIDLKSFVEGRHFDIFFSFLIFANAAIIGAEVQLQDPAQEDIFAWAAYCFNFLFFVELLLRLTAYGRSYFCPAEIQSYLWNYLDVVLVGMSVFEVVIEYMSQQSSQFTALRAVRTARMLRLLRVIRVIRFIHGLRTLVMSILFTLKSLAWSLVLLAIIMYVFGIIYTDIVSMHMTFHHLTGPFDPDSTEAKLQQNFGDLEKSMNTLFRSISGGMDWGDASDSLSAIHSAWGYLFVSYISFCCFAVLNVMTGVFCQRAMDMTSRDEQTQLLGFRADQFRILQTAQDLFDELDASGSGTLTLKELENLMHNESVTWKLQSIDMMANNSWQLFKLLDLRGAGEINKQDFVAGCFRLRGSARAMDVANLAIDNRKIRQKLAAMDKHESYMKHLLGAVSSMKADLSRERAKTAGLDAALSNAASGGVTKADEFADQASSQKHMLEKDTQTSQVESCQDQFRISAPGEVLSPMHQVQTSNSASGETRSMICSTREQSSTSASIDNALVSSSPQLPRHFVTSPAIDTVVASLFRQAQAVDSSSPLQTATLPPLQALLLHALQEDGARVSAFAQERSHASSMQADQMQAPLSPPPRSCLSPPPPHMPISPSMLSPATRAFFSPPRAAEISAQSRGSHPHKEIPLAASRSQVRFNIPAAAPQHDSELAPASEVSLLPYTAGIAKSNMGREPPSGTRAPLDDEQARRLLLARGNPFEAEPERPDLPFHEGPYVEMPGSLLS
eukprot:TRINITY_DN60213_c0_g1_i1.p1 TRINITY_DN60213_c0_g1~~TRINITY_DN60213_c0_g1_i1.p1  ORF type:complete len:952 (+),score=144.06 TRINITY_DN60213_c0_g1_i1:33-2858(+)